MIKIAIADDKPINRNILTDNLRRSGKVEVLFAAENGLDFLEKLKLQGAKNQLPQVVLMDIEMPELDGIEAVFRAKKAFPAVNFLMLTVFEDDAKIFEAIRSGAVGYLLKGESPDVLVRAIIGVALLFGVVGIGAYLRSDPRAETTLVKQPARLVERAAKPEAEIKTRAENPTPVKIPDAPIRQLAEPRPSPVKVEVAEAQYYCGAETKKGTPCSRRVKGNTRCYQHSGMPAMTSSERSKN